MKLWYNGKIMNVEDATIPITWMSPRISSGVFDGVRGYWNAGQQKLFMFRLQKHMGRFWKGCRIQKPNFDFSKKDLIKAAIDLIRINAFREDIYLVPNAFLGIDIAKGGSPVKMEMKTC